MSLIEPAQFTDGQEVLSHAREVKARMVANYERPRSYWQTQNEILTRQLAETRTRLQSTQSELEAVRADHVSLLARLGEPLPLGPVDIEKIQRAVCTFYKVSRNDMLSDRRTEHVVRARHIAMALCRTLTKESLPAIGRMFGDRDHSTVHHAITKLERDRVTVDGLDLEIRAITASLAACELL